MAVDRSVDLALDVEHRPSDSPYVERIYRAGEVTGSLPARMRSVANSNWELVFWHDRGETNVAVRGPETLPTVLDLAPRDGETVGIIFKHGGSWRRCRCPTWSTPAVPSPHIAATGLTQGTIRQIERARQAAILLSRSEAAIEVVHRVGYHDQPHLARSLTRFLGRTATQLRRPDANETLSLLYKTDAEVRP